MYSINPMVVSRYRERHRVDRAKSDHADAVTLANILRTDALEHRPLPDDSELAQSITLLARAQQDAVWHRTRLSVAVVDGQVTGAERRECRRQLQFSCRQADGPGGLTAGSPWGHSNGRNRH